MSYDNTHNADLLFMVHGCELDLPGYSGDLFVWELENAIAEWVAHYNQS